MATTPQAYARMTAAVARMFFVFRLMDRPSTASLTQPLNLWKLDLRHYPLIAFRSVKKKSAFPVTTSFLVHLKHWLPAA